MKTEQRIVAVSMETICREAVDAVATVLKSHGFERPAVVVNFVWKERANGGLYGIGTAIPKRYRSMMADCLEQSLEDARP